VASPARPIVAPSHGSERLGIGLVFGSALVWSFGGTLARFLPDLDSWTIVFFRGLFAALFLLSFMLLRDGVQGTLRMFRDMGWPGAFVGTSFAIASTCFILAIGYTTVANVILIQAGVPLLAALMAWIFFREHISLFTWIAIFAVIVGVGFMVSESLGASSEAHPLAYIGDLLALAIALVFAGTTVVTRRYTHVRMTPAACFGALIACGIAATQAPSFTVSGFQTGILFLLGAFNLGLGMALFVTGARVIPSPLVALLGTCETVLSPLWVALVHSEIPGERTIIGGIFVLVALLAYLSLQMRRAQETKVNAP
jgi:drug/metabolite transporter (DMT)-like permease